MSDLFERCHAFTAKWEGGLTNDAADAGGITNHGVSIAFLSDLAGRKPGVVTGAGIALPVTADTIRRLTAQQAAQLFRVEFWQPLRCDELPPAVALCLYDMAVNHGRAGAVKILQRAATIFDPGLAVDGKLGPKTMAVAKRMGSAYAVGIIANARQRYYDNIVARNPSQHAFLRGWTNRCRAMLSQALGIVGAAE